MGRGLSRHQKAVLEALKKKGSLDIWEAKHKDDEDYQVFRALRIGLKGEVKSIRNYSRLYRLMESLVRRGLAGRVLHMRPTRWIQLERDPNNQSHKEQHQTDAANL